MTLFCTLKELPRVDFELIVPIKKQNKANYNILGIGKGVNSLCSFDMNPKFLRAKLHPNSPSLFFQPLTSLYLLLYLIRSNMHLNTSIQMRSFAHIRHTTHIGMCVHSHIPQFSFPSRLHGQVFRKSRSKLR